jgi:hypothetical protein
VTNWANKAADHAEAEGAARFGTGSESHGDGQRAHNGGRGSHHDRAEAGHGPPVGGLGGSVVPGALEFQRKIHHHDRVLFNDADQHDQADKTVDIQLHVKDGQGQQAAKGSGGQARQNRDGVDKAFVEDA